MKNFISKTVFAILTLIAFSCKDYLDIIPDNIATIDNAFSNKEEAERYLYTCYSYMPKDANVNSNPAFYGGDECWIYWPLFSGQGALWSYGPNIARGLQNANDPFMNYWDGINAIGETSLFKGIRDCNIFLENVRTVYDLDESSMARWIAEVNFLKAYYHFYLFRMYGPIPIVDTNIDVTATNTEVKVSRAPVDQVVDYIATLLDSAASNLPAKIDNKTSELGRITKPIALALKAKLLVTAASPLFNGNTDYKGMMNADGTQLFNPVHNTEKWARAAAACKAAIDVCNMAGHDLYYFQNSLVSIPDALRTEMHIRNAVCERWNKEIVWGSYSGGTLGLQLQAMPRLNPTYIGNERTLGQLAPTMKIAEMFYSKNGVPILEDKTWDAANMYNTRLANSSHANYLQNGYTTAGLNFDREPRFYANLAFDGSLWYMANKTSWTVQAKYKQDQARKAAFGYSITGYFPKKLVNWKFEIKAFPDLSYEEYSWPIIRLADLYLLYAEAMNEANGPSSEVYEYLNKIRTRAGLKSVEESWSNFSTNPTKYATQSGLREIIRQERSIELALEGHRFWDLRRWKQARDEMSKPVYGWDIVQETATNYYRRKQLFIPTFVSPRDYLWPIKTNNIIVNRKLVQNTGW